MYVRYPLLCLWLVVFTVAASAENWPMWRGPLGTGAAPSGNPPLTWSETTNIRWKTPLPGSGVSTPIVWGDQIFLLTAVPENAAAAAEAEAEAATADRGSRGGPPRSVNVTGPVAFNILCLDKQTGSIQWEQTAVTATPHEGHHPTGSFAPFSPVTDGEHLYVSYGSRGLYCYTFDGALVWKADLPEMHTRRSFGEGSSPALTDEAVIVVADQEGPSEILAFDKKTGEALWRTDRDEVTSWSTPVVARVGGMDQIIANGTTAVRGYDARTGDVIWSCGGQTANVIPTPVVGDGVVYCTSGFRGAAFYAIELGRTGDLTGTDAVRWSLRRNTPYVPSPLLYEGRIYLNTTNKSMVSCYQADDGTPLYTNESLRDLGILYASPVGVGGKVYVADRDGNVAVLRAGDTFEVLATNTLDDGFDASPAVSGDLLFLRSTRHLYCIAED